MKTWIKTLIKTTARIAAIAICAVMLATPWLASRHFVRSERGWVVVPKRYLALRETCVDVRGWDWRAFDRRPAIRDALVRNGYAELVPERPPAAGRERLAASWAAFQKNAVQAMRDFQRDTADRFADWLAEMDKRWFGE